MPSPRLKKYASKDQLFEDYPLAVKFKLSRDLDNKHRITDYDALLKALTTECATKVRELGKVRHYRSRGVSVAYYLEVDVKDDAGESLGPQFVLVKHESGPDIFFAAHSLLYVAQTVGAVMVGAWVAKAGQSLASQGVSILKKYWARVLPPGIEIASVRIRHANYGEIWLPFSQFEPSLIDCMIEHLPRVRKHLSELGDTCFSDIDYSTSADEVSARVTKPGRSLKQASTRTRKTAKSAKTRRP